MKKVKIFIGSSIEELKEDRIAIGNFFRQLNDLYLDSGLYFQLVMCEDYDDAISAEGKQSQYDREILDSALSVFIFHRKVGEYTRHEFAVAYRQFKAELRPKILTVFKCSDGEGKIDDGAKSFAEELDGELKHYYKTYSNIDSLKLWLIMQIKTMGLDQSKVEFVGGRVLINGETVANYDKAPAFSQHASLTEQKEKLRRLSDEYLQQKAAYLEDPENIDLYVSYSSVAKLKAEAEEAVAAAESEILSQLERIYAATEKGELSPRQVLGYRLIETGKYNEALAVLDRKEICLDIEKSEREYALGEAMVNAAKKKLEMGVNELLQRIEALRLQGVTTAVAEEIYELYERACELCRKYEFQPKVFIKYANFLLRQNRNDEAYQLLSSIESRFEKGASFYEKAEFYESFSDALFKTGKRDLEWKYTQKALKIAEGLYSIEESEENANLCGKILYATAFCKAEPGTEKAQEYAQRALKIYQGLHAQNPKKYARQVSNCYIRIGYLTDDMNAQIDRYIDAYNVLEPRLYQKDTTDDEKKAGGILCKRLAKYFAKKSFEKGSLARKLMDNAFVWMKDLAEKNPAAYAPLYAVTLSDYADLLWKYTKEALAEKMRLLAISVYKKLYAEKGEKYARSLGFEEESLGDYYTRVGDERSATYYRSALKRYQVLTQKKSATLSERAWAYYSVGYLYAERLQEKGEAKAYFEQALKLYEEMEKTGGLDDSLQQRVAWICRQLGISDGQ